MKSRLFLACFLGVLVLVFQDTAKSTFPALRWKIESITSGVMHGVHADLPACTKAGPFYVFEDDAHKGYVAQCRKPGWSIVTYRDYQRLVVLSKELGMPVQNVKITTASVSGSVTEYAWDNYAPVEQRVHTAVSVTQGGITRDWTVSAIQRGKVDPGERASIAVASAAVLGVPVNQMAGVR